MVDFKHALEEIKPAFGVDDESLSIHIREGIHQYGDRFNKL
jgi:hypothetical protein